jgi:hypothetical protein
MKTHVLALTRRPAPVGLGGLSVETTDPGSGDDQLSASADRRTLDATFKDREGQAGECR